MYRENLAQPFERLMGCRAVELANWLSRALPGADLELESQSESGRCRALFEDGLLLIEWQVLEPRKIALLLMPQLKVRFSYSGLGQARRLEVQNFFDLATQRGGG